MSSDRPSIDYQGLFDAAPNPYVLMAPDLTIVTMNDAYLKATMRERDDIAGKSMFDTFPSDPESESYKQLRTSLERVVETARRDEIPLIRYDIQQPSGEFEERYWSATHTPLLDDRGEVAYILQHTVDVTELHQLRTLAANAGNHARDEYDVFRRASAVQEANQTLAQETRRLRSMFEQAPGFVAILDGPDHRLLMANKAYRQLVGNRDIIGKPIAQALPEVVDQGFVTLLDQVRSSGEAFVGEGVPVFLEPSPGAPLEERLLDFIYQPISAQSGEGTGVFVQGHDVSEQHRIKAHQQLLINGLNHRVKNTLAIVQGLAMQSFRPGSDPETSRRAFDARLNALSTAHNLLTSQNWESTGLFDMIKAAVSAAAGDNAQRVRLQGPDISLAPQTAVSLAMAIHELCTNAIKYGALSNDVGVVDVQWTAESAEDGRSTVTLDWTESGGPPVAPPARKGFGTRLIERGLSAELRSDVAIEFLPGGLHCRISARLPRASA
ncbi:PAS domain-containing protein [Sphingomonas sabuli]|uniref:histidine kinase n=1 Tax=Sphingomonas sabuli TaxID=2764186 RepID=A0A7G9KZX1_9SPHN|nr:PAS domain-containing protein [Sphingomonas sabuli]QNM81920.1 PAS domain-containing protein [Sphingomonas sabuli]